MKKFLRKHIHKDGKRSIKGTWFFGRAVLELGIGWELWYFTRSGKHNDYRIHHLLHIGLTQMPSPQKNLNANLLVITFLLFTMKIGYIGKGKPNE